MRLSNAEQAVLALAARLRPDMPAPSDAEAKEWLYRLGESYRHGRHPEHKAAKPVAQLLRALAAELDS